MSPAPPRWLAGLLVAACACTGGDKSSTSTSPDAVDSDGDGLIDSAEAAHGADPDDPDSDGDGLLDGEEVGLGTDPAKADTDDDSYRDPDEIAEGTDPLDPASVIYRGGWPYVADKDAIDGPDPDPAGIAVGARFARIALADQYGDTVDLYDFYSPDGSGKPVVIDISAQWCEPCQTLSSWLEGGADPDDFGALWPRGPDAIAAGELHWITVLSEDAGHLPATPAVAPEWAEVFDAHGPILADDGYLAANFVGIVGYPTLALLEPDLTVTVFDRENGIDVVLTALAERFPAR